MAKLADLFVKLVLNNSSFNSGLKDSQKKASNFGNGIKNIGGLLAGAFAVGKIISFGKELIQLGGVAEGVRSAFNRIADDKVLKGLKDATKGTVSELELMKRAVMASNFNIPVKQLASLFRFATKRAQETGESVDYLVNSIVLGIGRKSPLILDNLGISAVDLRQKLEGVGHAGATVGDVARAVGEIAEDAMAKSGDIIDTNAIKVENLGAQWENVKLKIAESKTVLDFFTSGIDTLDKALTILESEHLSFWEKINIFQSQDKTFDISTKRLADFKALTEKSTGELNKLLEAETARHEILEKSGGDFDVYLESERSLTRLRESIQAISKERQESANHIDKESTAYRNQIAAEQDAALLAETHIKTIGELKAETEELRKSLDLYNLSQWAEYAATEKRIQANEDLLASFGKAARVATPEQISSSGETPQIGLDFKLEEGLADMQSFFDKLEEQLKNFTADYLSEWDQFRGSLKNLITDGIVSVVDDFGQAIESIFAGDFNMKDLGGRLLGTIGSFLGDFGKMLIAYGIAQAAFWDSFAMGPAGAALAIGAGVALVAIGGAIKGVGKRVSNGDLSAGGSSGGISSSSYNPQGNALAEDNTYIFKLQGTELIGLIENTNRRNGIIG